MGKAKLKPAPADAVSSGNVLSISAAKPKANALAAKVAEKAKAAADASLVVFGRDDSGKPHASWFGPTDAELAIRAASMMKFKLLPITTDDHRAAALQLTQGRVFASGRAFSPFCREAAYGALEAFPEAFQPPVPVEPEPEPPIVATGMPQQWGDIAVGALVLANAGDEWGWHEAIVTEARGDDIFVLLWQNWPDDPAFARRRDGLALLPTPAMVAA